MRWNNRDNLDLSLLPVLIGHMTGNSVDTMAQFGQNHDAGQTFQAFDYGAERNRLVYGSSRPKTYDLSRVTVPVHIYFSKNDRPVNYRDVLWLSTQLANVQSLNLISDPQFSHSDFMWGTNVNEVLYDGMFPLLPDP